ncbi:hypothetical protein B0H16DRAFT_223353 [Mycena metata]|uniref:Uncharacterized protein n=1 Tax=Mycena metata TaxID=1033252 RepID=A0AAD7MRV7_9AGAR|nr:hypothetical protein B0H16DRAFT_223353 [Mycena metata]
MGGSIYACKPSHDAYSDNVASADYSYRGFMGFKLILVRGTIAFLTALSGKQISRKLLVDEGVAVDEDVNSADEAVVIANYRARINEAILLLQRWDRNLPDADPMALFTGSGDIQSIMTALMNSVPIDIAAIEAHKTVPPTLAQLRLSGIYIFSKHPDVNGCMKYEDAKEVERLLRLVKPYCYWDPEKWIAPDEGELHFMDEMIQVFATVPPGGTVRN